MTLSRRFVIKGTIAVLVGVPGTLVFSPLAVFLLFAGLSQSLAFLLWGFAACAGIVGFWVWVFARSTMSTPLRAGIFVSVLAGVFAVMPLALEGHDSSFQSTFAFLGVLVGLVICGWLVLPNLPLNPDARDNGQVC